MSQHRLPWLCFGVFLCALVGCGTQPPRTIADIERELQDLPKVYLTETSGREIVAPASSGDCFIDAETGEIAWLAYTCKNPACPGKDQGKNGRPWLFIWNDPTVKIRPDGTLPHERGGPPPGEKYADYIERLGGFIEPTCPACLKLRNRKTESTKDRNRYADWVVLYTPPEATQRKQELEAEKKAWELSLKERAERKMNKGE